MQTHFDRPLAVITGASSGIGYELAKQFARNGFDLVVAAEDPGIVEARQAFESLGAKVEAVQVDLSTYDGVEDFVHRLHSFQSPVDTLVLNAGVGVGGDFARETDLEAELALIRLNVQSVVHLTKRILPAMVERQAGRLLFTSSLASTAPGPYFACYAASKAFVHSFAEALRVELKETGIAVTSLMPGPTDTDFFRRAGMEDTKVGQGPKDSAEVVAREGFEALMANKDHVLAGRLKNKIQGSLGSTLPDHIKAEMQAKETKPHTQP